jgi:hypothetical protein
MSHLTYVDRSKLPDSAFALPERRHGGRGGLPLTNKHGHLDPKHIGNAAARLSMMVNRGSVTRGEAQRAHARIRAAACKVGMPTTCATGERVMENPMLHDPVGDLVAANPLPAIGVAFGVGAVVAASIAYYLMGRSAGTAAPVTTTTTTTTAPTTTTTSPAPTTSTSSSTSSSSAPSTSSSSSAPSTSSTPTFNAANAVQVATTGAGKNLIVGTSIQLWDPAVGGGPVAGTLSATGILAPGPTPGTFVAIAPGTVKVTTSYHDGAGIVQPGILTIVVKAATGTSGVPDLAATLLRFRR